MILIGVADPDLSLLSAPASVGCRPLLHLSPMISDLISDLAGDLISGQPWSGLPFRGDLGETSESLVRTLKASGRLF